jgi:serine/threonine protein kinase
VARRLPSSPPVLAGFSHMRVLGSGGFADVFLYEQNMPRRQVAVKVLLSEVVNDQVRQMFQAEANLMAQLSAHPSILTVYQASVSADGRPYLVMELCSPSLGARYRAERIPVIEVLRIAVRIGSAVETAHRAGVLHRDIKPSNILLTAYGHPVLSDFGIAATLAEMEGQESVGMSIPWSAPEVLLDESPGSVRAEVWSLAATVYSLLAGRSPFEIAGGSNASSDLISRITRGKPQPIDRPDVPRSLDRLLMDALSRKPDNRPASVLELIHGFQAIETELGVAQTPIEVAMDDWARATVSDLDDRTQIRVVTSPNSGAGGRRRRAHSTTPNPSDQGALRTSAAAATPARRRFTAVTWAFVVSSALVLALATTAVVVMVRAASPGIPVVSDVAADITGTTVEFSWRDPGVRAGDVYSISTGPQTSIQRSTDFLVDAEPGDRVCVTVTVNRDGKAGDASGEKCVDVPE